MANPSCQHCGQTNGNCCINGTPIEWYRSDAEAQRSKDIFEPIWCHFCQEYTYTESNDCIQCKLSKPTGTMMHAELIKAKQLIKDLMHFLTLNHPEDEPNYEVVRNEARSFTKDE